MLDDYFDTVLAELSLVCITDAAIADRIILENKGYILKLLKCRYDRILQLDKGLNRVINSFENTGMMISYMYTLDGRNLDNAVECYNITCVTTDLAVSAV
jgi:hypothetical protein